VVVYREHEPPPDPHGLYACAWSRTSDGRPVLRIVPDACVDVIWHRESGHLFIAGPDTRPHVGPIDDGTLIGLRFSPGSAPAALRVPADELRDGRVPLDSVWRPADVRRLDDDLAAAESDVDAQRILAAAVNEHAAGDRDWVADGVLRMLRSDMDIASIASATELSERQLHRRCRAAFGYGAKTLHRVLRFDRALRLARGGFPFADVAYRVGYADQAHLAREVKALSGVPLSRLVRGSAES
jgi:AraC-like DNA-binding protein